MKYSTISVWFTPLVFAAGVMLGAEPSKSPDDAMSASNGIVLPDLPLFKLVGLAEGLELNPKLIEPTDGNGTSVGIQYKYDRYLTGGGFLGSKKTDYELRIRSEGLVVVEQTKSPNRLLTHGLRFSAIDLLPESRSKNPDRVAHVAALVKEIQYNHYFPWQRTFEKNDKLKAQLDSESDSVKKEALTVEISTNSAQMVTYVSKAERLLKEYGTLETDIATHTWNLKSGGRDADDWISVLNNSITERRWVFLSFDADVNAETDQTFQDVQLVGSGEFRGKLLLPILDYPFRAFRDGGGLAKNWLNRDGGPYFYAGAAAVDASENDSRKAITTEHEQFARAQLGASYRTEVFSTTADNAVALELSWRYYYEFDAPAAIRASKLDNTSYFKATLLFPGNYFLEYTDGRLPLDVESATTVSVGWRHNF